MGTARIFSLEPDEIGGLIAEDAITVCVVGIGRMGMPIALSFAKSGIRTVGVDINKRLVDDITGGRFPLADEPGYEKIFKDVTGDGRFTATTEIGAVSGAQVILLSLPTPMDERNVPDYTALRTVGRRLGELATPGSVIIVESTIEPGFIEDEFVGLVEGGGRLRVGTDIGVGVCPETANPGEIMRDFERLPRMVGATDGATAQVIEKIYGHVFPVELVRMPDCKTANAVKLVTNVFRDVNIAFVNELALLCERLGMDIGRILEAADKKYNFQVHYPGAGVGGPCLPVNSYQLLSSAGRAGDNMLRMVRVGREINERMPYHIVELLVDALKEGGREIGSSCVLVLGVSYKPNVRDTQLSPAGTIISELVRLGARVRIFDPHFRGDTIYGIKAEDSLDAALPQADAAVIVTGHREFKGIGAEYFTGMRSPILVDARGVIEAPAAKKAGLVFRGLGRGA